VLRIALISDVHGNTHALDAVLADAASVGHDEVWVLGDLAALGPEPCETLARLTGLPAVRFVRGNTDRYVVTGERPPPTAADVRARPELAVVAAEVDASFAWTARELERGGWLGWMAALPASQRLVLPDGTRLLGVHADPRRDDGPGLGAHVEPRALQSAVAGASADVVCAGHTHRPYDGTVGGTRVVNLGSVSNPLAPDLRASYVVLEAAENRVPLRHRRVDYDREAVVDALERRRHPGRAWITAHLRGEHRAAPMVKRAGRDADDHDGRDQ
jgi:predicted phosphodiesterase